MSYIQYVVKCPKCKKRFNTAFGIVGTDHIAEALKECPECKVEVVQVKEGWDETR